MPYRPSPTGKRVLKSVPHLGYELGYVSPKIIYSRCATIWLMDHLNEVVRKVAEDPSKAWEIAKTVAQLSAKVFNFRKTLKSSGEKHQVDEILDALSELKQSAGELEDENRELREKLRFKSDDFVFRNPFWYHKGRPDEPLCAKCFANHVEGHVGEPGVGVSPNHRHCLVCGSNVALTNQQFRPSPRLRSDFPGSR